MRTLLSVHPSEVELPKVLLLSGHSLDLIMSCPRQAYFYLIRKKRAALQTDGRMVGAAMHAALQCHYASWTRPRLRKYLLNTVRAVFTHNLRALPCTDYRTADYMTELYTAYAEEYANEEFDLITINGKPLLEASFDLPLGNCNGVEIRWRGRIDLLTKFPMQYFTLDHKYMKYADTHLYESHFRSLTQHGYVWAASKLLNLPFSGYVINAIIGRKFTRTGTPFEFRRLHFTLDSTQIERFPERVLSIVEPFLYCIRTNNFPEAVTQCVTKYGLCDYYPVCSSGYIDQTLNSNLYTTTQR